MIYKKSQGRKFAWEHLEGFAYNDRSVTPQFTSAVVETTSSHGKIKNRLSDIIYFVAEGKGEFWMDNAWQSVEKDDCIHIPKNTPFDFRANNGTLKLFIVHTPGYDPKNEEQLNS